MSPRPLHFNGFIWPNGYHESAWRVVDDDVRNVLGLSYYTDIARIAERGLMDSIFLADNIAIAEYRATYLPQTQFDPISVLSALAAVTRDAGPSQRRSCRLEHRHHRHTSGRGSFR
jgi:alkanesulfonate monooxygenase SsuD/methylene tetrahydromethanopterin reductase-like flavin-dependent oxidoreductase (luciferase family)